MEDLVHAQHAAGQASFALVHGRRASTGESAGAGGGVEVRASEKYDDTDASMNTATLSDPAWLRRVPVWREFAFAPIAPGFLGALNVAIDDWKPDYLHFHVPNLSALAALASRRARRLPWVVHWHADVVASPHSFLLRLLYPLYRPFERALLERATVIVCTSQPYLETSEPLQPFRDKCVVVALGISTQRFDSRPVRADASVRPLSPAPAWSEGRFRVLAVGRLTYYKGFDTLISAVAQCPNVELRIVGDGADRAALNSQIDRLGVADRVFIEGGLTDAQCADRFASAHLFCLPSRERTEAFGLVLLEAMWHRLPILASALLGSGVLSVVRANQNGRLLPIDEPSAWRDGIQAIRNEPSARKALGDYGRRLVETRYGIASVERRLRGVVNSTLSPDSALPEAHARPLIVIPARNEATTIHEVLAGLHAQGYRDILVVDDGSNDETGRIAREAGARVLRAPLAQGAWGAMQCGIRYAVRHNFSSVITMDADGQHRPEELHRLFRAAWHADVVIGACPARGSPARKFAWALFRKLTGFDLSDLTSGFRLYNSAACAVLASDRATLIDYQDMGVLLLLRRTGLRFAEVDVEMSPRVNGISRIFYSWWAVSRYMVETLVLCALGLGARKLRA